MPSRQTPLRCPRCGLTLTFRAPWIASLDCARCKALADVAVKLVPVTGIDSPAVRERGRQHRRRPTAVR